MIDAIKQRFVIVLSLLVLIWLASIFAFVLDPKPLPGILPRTIQGLPGIVFAPFIHGSFNHLLVNTVGLFGLSWMVAWRGAGYFALCTASIIIIGGLGVWLFGRFNYHIGASGLIFGYLGFLVARAFVEKSFRAILFAALVVFLYGGMIWGILPSDPRISWEAHLFGLLAGVFTSVLMANVKGKPLV